MRRGNFRGRGRNQGNWPGNGPFRHLPPWERPGWIYGRGSCWYGAYSGVGSIPSTALQKESQILVDQKGILEEQLRSIQERLEQIETRLSDLDSE
ncbi:unnamed protein product [marine sediment metagenome]|uniref:DUF5320 domain-containing protein n=1 Tax=marine sediment metagenome TaxID=412755 RepID=X1A127_9ZZZZ